MIRRILSLLSACSVVFMLSTSLVGCRQNPSDENPSAPTTVTDSAGYSVKTDGQGNTQVVDEDGNVIADSANGDTIQVDSDGSISFVDEEGNRHNVSPSPDNTDSAASTTTTLPPVTPTTSGTPSGTDTPDNPDTPAPTPAVDYDGILPGSAEGGAAFSTLSKAPADNAVSVEGDTKQFGRFLLTTADNPALPFNVACFIGADRISAVVPADADLSAVKANFTYYGKNVLYNGTELTSRATAMDLTQDATLTLCAQDGSTCTMTVHIERLATGLPSMSVNTAGYRAVQSNKEYQTASFTIGGGDNAICSYATTTQTRGADCSIKGRGNTTWTYDKKAYTLRFDTKYPLLDLPESKNYVLLALYADQSLMRYRLGEMLSESVGLEYTMKLRYVDLWLNGQYMGVYGLTEKIEVEKNRVAITDYVNTSTPVNKMGYLLEFDDHLYTNSTEEQRASWRAVGKGYYDASINETFFYLNTLGTDWITIRTTNAKNLTADHVNYIYAVVSNAMDALKAGDYATISAYIDVESFVKWYLIEEYLNNTDSDMTSSVYMYIDVGGKLCLGPLWDLDNCAGNHTATADATAHTLYDSDSGWFSYLFRCDEARRVLKAQWDAMQSTLGRVNETLDATQTLLTRAAALNFFRWPTLGQTLDTQPAAIASADTFDAQVTYLKDYLARRQSALDAFYRTI